MLKTSDSHSDSEARKYSQQGWSRPQRAGLDFCAAFLLLWPSPGPTNTVPFLKLLPPPHSWLPAQFLITSFCGVRIISRLLYHFQGLKKNWEEVHKEFQSLSVFIDSIPKKIRKQKLEEEMKQLEHDISVIEKHKIIYIANK